MHLIVPDLYPLGIARKSGGGLHCHLHVRWSYRSPRGRYRNIDFRREELDGFHRISGEDDALFRLQRFIVDGGSFQGVRAFLVEKRAVAFPIRAAVRSTSKPPVAPEAK